MKLTKLIRRVLDTNNTGELGKSIFETMSYQSMLDIVKQHDEVAEANERIHTAENRFNWAVTNAEIKYANAELNAAIAGRELLRVRE